MVYLIMDASRRRLEAEQNGRIWLAWHTEYFARCKRLPRFDSLLIKRKAKRVQSWQDIRDTCRVLTLAYGGLVRG